MGGIITEDMFRDMLKALDEDGDGTVTKEEFKTNWIKLHNASGKPTPTELEFEATWADVDKDGSGTLEANELATHFGFDLNKGSEEMTEEQILEALSMQSFLFDEIFKKLSKESSGRRKSFELERVPRPVGPKQTRLYLGVTSVKVPTAVKQDVEDERLRFLFACESGDKGEIMNEWIQGKKVTRPLMYIEDDARGETPLMKMSRHGMKDEIRECMAIISDTKLEDAARYYMNLQDKQGKSCLFQAAEYQHAPLVDFFLQRGADCMLVMKTGWTVLHLAVSSAKSDADAKTVETILTHERVAPFKMAMLRTRDQTGRTAIHIASFKNIDAVTKLLLEHGADPTVKDDGGNDGVGLAERTGRRRSKELLEEFIKKKEGDGGK